MNADLVLFIKAKPSKTFALTADMTVIGRRRSCDFRIPVESVSRRHCQLTIDHDKLMILDLDSRNGTFVNGKKVQQQQLKAGDIIKIGPVVLGLRINGEPETFVNLTQLSVPGDDTALSIPDDLLDDEIDLGDSDVFSDLDLDESDEIK